MSFIDDFPMSEIEDSLGEPVTIIYDQGGSETIIAIVEDEYFDQQLGHLVSLEYPIILMMPEKAAKITTKTLINIKNNTYKVINVHKKDRLTIEIELGSD